MIKLTHKRIKNFLLNFLTLQNIQNKFRKKNIKNLHAVLQNPGINIVPTSFQGIFQLKIKHPTFEDFLVYKFTCTRRNFRYIGKIWRHFKTRIDEQVKR